MARTQRFTAKTVADAITATQGLVYIAADLLGCSPVTVYTYMKRYPSVKRAHEEANERSLDVSEWRLFEERDRGNIQAIKYHLSTKGKHRGYGPEETRHHVTMQLDEELRSARSRITDSLTKTRERLANGQHNGAPEKHIEHTP